MNLLQIRRSSKVEKMERNELRKCFPKKSNASRDEDWRAFGTLSTVVEPEKAEKSMIRWFAEIRHAFFPGFLNWVAVFEGARFESMLRIHILTNGFDGRQRDTWSWRWKQLASGEAWLYSYRGRQDFVEYLDSEAQPNRYWRTEFDLNGVKSFEWKYPYVGKRTMGDRFEKLF